MVSHQITHSQREGARVHEREGVGWTEREREKIVMFECEYQQQQEQQQQGRRTLCILNIYL